MVRTIFAFLFVMLIACSSKKEERAVASTPPVNEYPDLVLSFSDGEKLSAKTLKGNNIFILFQPDCDHCQHEAVEIGQRLNEFKDYTLYFISSSPMEQIMKFAKDFDLASKKNVRFAWTTNESVLTYYGSIPTPSIYVYSKGELRTSFNGQTPVGEIVKAL